MPTPRRPAWLRPPRRLRLHRAGWVFSGGTLLLGLAAIATGNNLLFLLLGALLGFIALSGVMSEQVLRGVRVRRQLPRGVVAGRPARIVYEVENAKRRLPSFALEIGEAGRAECGFVAALEPGRRMRLRVEAVFERRGVYPLPGVTLATSFPFGLFRKERDLALAGELVVWPRTDRPVREVRTAGVRARHRTGVAVPAPGARGEYRGLRDYRPGDDPRDVHWRSTARRAVPVVREYEREEARSFWLCLDPRAADDAAAEAAVETLATLAARAERRGQPFGVAAAGQTIPPGTGPLHLERVLDLLARARLAADAPLPRPPAPPAECVLVSAAPRAAAGWADVLHAAEVAEGPA